LRHQQDQRLENSVEWYSPNTVYERFFQGYSVKIADTHGIVYTPQPIVDFMCAAVEEVLETEFGAKLGDESVWLIDPCTSTGNFIVNLLRRAHQHNPRDFESFYCRRRGEGVRRQDRFNSARNGTKNSGNGDETCGHGDSTHVF
jgi:hypothetical protein